MKNELNAFEKFLAGKKTYILAVVTVVYGVVLQGYHQHHWTSIGGAVTWLLAGGGVACFRAAIAEIQTLLTNAFFPAPPVPPMNGVTQLTSPVTDNQGQPVTDPNAPR